MKIIVIFFLALIVPNKMYAQFQWGFKEMTNIWPLKVRHIYYYNYYRMSFIKNHRILASFSQIFPYTKVLIAMHGGGWQG